MSLYMSYSDYHLFSDAAHLEGLVRGAALLGKGAALSGSYSLQIITAELFPTVIR